MTNHENSVLRLSNNLAELMKYLYILLALPLFSSCNSTETPSIDVNSLTADLFEGIYLSDNTFFPDDTLILNAFTLKDTSTMKKLMIQFKNDSIYLSNYKFGGWYGKWFCPFEKAQANFTEDRLTIHTKKLSYSPRNEETWRKIEYQLIDSSVHSFTLVKLIDSTNSVVGSPFRNIYTHLGRGGRDFTTEVGEEIRSDIQLR